MNTIQCYFKPQHQRCKRPMNTLMLNRSKRLTGQMPMPLPKGERGEQLRWKEMTLKEMEEKKRERDEERV